jgi:hypothetical protein
MLHLHLCYTAGIEKLKDELKIKTRRIEYNELARKWNYKILGGQAVGRPLAASEAQIALRDAGMSLRTIAEETSLGLNTVPPSLTRSAALAERPEGARC